LDIGCKRNEFGNERVPFYPYIQDVSEVTGKGEFVSAGMFPSKMLRSILEFQQAEATIVIECFLVSDLKHLQSAVIKLTAAF